MRNVSHVHVHASVSSVHRTHQLARASLVRVSSTSGWAPQVEPLLVEAAGCQQRHGEFVAVTPVHAVRDGGVVVPRVFLHHCQPVQCVACECAPRTADRSFSEGAGTPALKSVPNRSPRHAREGPGAVCQRGTTTCVDRLASRQTGGEEDLHSPAPRSRKKPPYMHAAASMPGCMGCHLSRHTPPPQGTSATAVGRDRLRRSHTRDISS